MGKGFNAFILAAFFSALTHCAYGQLLVFGPDFFFSEAGNSQRVTKDFPVQDTNQKYLLSIQCGESGDKGIKATITINGDRIAMPAEFRDHLMITEPVSLRKQNEISVEATSEADASLLVAIMSMEKHTVTAEIPLLGKIVDIDGYAEVVFPSGSFSTAQSVTVTAIASPITQHLFEADATVLHLPCEIRINSGDHSPAKDIPVSVRVHDSFIDSDYEIHIFAQMHDNPETPDLHDRFFKQVSGGIHLAKTVVTKLPGDAFSNLYGENGTYEAINCRWADT